MIQIPPNFQYFRFNVLASVLDRRRGGFSAPLEIIKWVLGVVSSEAEKSIFHETCVFLCLFLILFAAPTFATETNYVNHQLLIQCSSSLHQSLIMNFAAIDLKPTKCLSHRLNIWLFEFDATQIDAKTVVHDLRSYQGIQNVQLNHFVELRTNHPDDPYFDYQWHLENTGQEGGTIDADIDAPEAWHMTTGGLTALGQEIIIAIIDAGFDLDHNDLLFWKNLNEIPNNGIDDDQNGYIDDYDGWNAYNSSGIIVDHDHGTHVTGIAAANGNNGQGVCGINWGTKVLPVMGASQTESIVIEAYGYVLEMRARYNETNGEDGAFIVVTNASFGVDFGDPDDYPLWCAIYDSLGAVGILSAAATANRNINVDISGDIPTTCSSDFLIAVTNTTRWDTKRSGAAYGASSIDLGAPGTSIYATRSDNRYGTKTGTSMASPHVAGAVALLFAAADSALIREYMIQPAIYAQQFKQWLLAGVDTISALEGITLTGGRLNLNRALIKMNENHPSLLTGTVVNAENGSPIPAHIIAQGAYTYETIADSAGDYSLTVLADRYTLLVTYENYLEFETEFQIEQDTTLTLDIALVSSDYAIVRGEVRDRNNGMPLVGEVRAINDTIREITTTDSNGFYSFQLFPGNYTLQIGCEGYIDFLTEFQIDRGDIRIINANLISQFYFYDLDEDGVFTCRDLQFLIAGSDTISFGGLCDFYQYWLQNR